MEAVGLVFRRRKFVMSFSHDAPEAWPVWAPRARFIGAWLAGFIKMTTIHCYIQNMKAPGLVVSENFFFMMPLGRGLYEPSGARSAGFIKRTIIHCYTQNMKALGLVVSEKIFYVFFPVVNLWELTTLGAGPFLTPGACLAGFIEDHYALLHTKYKSFGHCGLGEDVLCFSHDAPGAGPV